MQNVSQLRKKLIEKLDREEGYKLNLKEIIKKMTLEEKISQLIQLTPSFYEGEEGQVTGPMEEIGISENVIRNSGSVLGISGAENVMKIQEKYLKKNPHGIPLLVMADVIHGYKTIFPVPLGIGSSWDMKLAEKSAEIAAKESAVSGIHVTFAPMVDLVRDPRWGRVVESTGEDPLLNSEFAKAFIRGFQGNNLTNEKERVAACVKHFAAYGAAEGGRDYNSVDMSERQLREFYLPPYKAAIDEGCKMVMTSFNTVDGIPATGNKHLMRDILRDEWGFNGVLISDWGAVKEMIPHGVAKDESEAARKAIEAGVDIEMMTACYIHHLKSLVNDGIVDENLIDAGVLRILRLKEKLGLFNNPYRGADVQREKEVVLCEEHRQIARELATKSCVLLKNDHVLPLKKQQKVALVGPFAQNGDILGPWSWLGSKETSIQLFNGMKTKIDSSQINVAKGCNIETGSEKMLEKAIEAAKCADVIVLALGESSNMSGEAHSRANIKLPEVQLNLVRNMKMLNKPIVIVLFNGRPLDLKEVVEQTDALLEAWYPGIEGGAAIADLIFGDVNPSGKLSMSFPYSVGQVPAYYNGFNTGRPAINYEEEYVSKYLDIPNEPLFPFGFGLSYTTFTYSDLELSDTNMTVDQPIYVSVQVTNTGKIAGEEIVQFYVRDLTGEVVRPVKELKGFKKITLQPGETKEVTFSIKEEQLQYYHSDLHYTSDAGAFQLFVGPNSRDAHKATFTLGK
ncbi:glycoside hydrolase family 3 C-terminal domain-containing protein [Bacillaceae bacterium Marseille-Q3522]|nr:glycoside hydrolase family 3 C-terminal domain-containing protein [Bacillaceae bacterium Marseille-Q3522]